MGWSLKFRTSKGTEGAMEMPSGPAMVLMAGAAAAMAGAAVALVKVANGVETVAKGVVELARDPERGRALAEGVVMGIRRGTSGPVRLVRNARQAIGR
jgi:hypothetical protein